MWTRLVTHTQPVDGSDTRLRVWLVALLLSVPKSGLVVEGSVSRGSVDHDSSP